MKTLDSMLILRFIKLTIANITIAFEAHWINSKLHGGQGGKRLDILDICFNQTAAKSNNIYTIISNYCTYMSL